MQNPEWLRVYEHIIAHAANALSNLDREFNIEWEFDSEKGCIDFLGYDGLVIADLKVECIDGKETAVVTTYSLSDTARETLAGVLQTALVVKFLPPPSPTR